MPAAPDKLYASLPMHRRDVPAMWWCRGCGHEAAPYTEEGPGREPCPKCRGVLWDHVPARTVAVPLSDHESRRA